MTDKQIVYLCSNAARYTDLIQEKYIVVKIHKDNILNIDDIIRKTLPDYHESLPDLLRLHYDRDTSENTSWKSFFYLGGVYHHEHTDEYWKEFVQQWLDKCSYLILCYTTKNDYPSMFEKNPKSYLILGCMILMNNYKQSNELYIRILCTRCKKGANMLQWLHDTFVPQFPEIHRISLNAEPYAINFYKRAGYHLCSSYYTDNSFRRFFVMIKPVNGMDIDDIIGNETLHVGMWGHTIYIVIIIFLIVISWLKKVYS